MPCYRIDGGIICMGRRGAPRHCGVRGCGRMAAYLCDGPARGATLRQAQGEARDGETCDRPLCEGHAREVARNRHLCPDCETAPHVARPGELAL